MPVDDSAVCRDIVRRHARTFWLASHFLTRPKRRAAFALYAFCRVADDMVDEGAAGLRDDVAEQLRGYRGQLDAALAGAPEGPVFRELHAAATQYQVPSAVLHELLDGVARDCAPVRYESWAELVGYCGGVASSVGEMCTYVFGVAGDATTRARALSHARTLGLAMQVTNILRDVGEDARIGRCYLPADELSRFGLTRDEVLAGGLAADPRWRAFMAHMIARARALYDEAMPGIALLAPDSRRCAMACAVGYAGILGAIERNGYDTFTTRARLGTVARAGVLWTAWRGVAPALAPVSGSRGEHDGGIARWA